MKIIDFINTTLMEPNIVVYHNNKTNNCESLYVTLMYDKTIIGYHNLSSYNNGKDDACIYLANQTDSSYWDAIQNFLDKPAILNNRLGYEFLISMKLDGLVEGMLSVNWLMTSVIGQSGRKTEPRINTITREQGISITTVQIGYYENTEGILGFDKSFYGIGDTFGKELIVGEQINS